MLSADCAKASCSSSSLLGPLPSQLHQLTASINSRRSLGLRTAQECRYRIHGVASLHGRVTPVQTKAAAMPSVNIKSIAQDASSRPGLPRSGACAVTLPPGTTYQAQPAIALLFGGYTEEPSAEAGSPPKRQAAEDAYVFVPGSDGQVVTGRWVAVQYTGADVPRARLVAQAAVAGQHLWLVGGWDPSTPGTGGDILSDVWRLDLSTWAWEQMAPSGVTLPAISRFQMQALGDKLIIHMHRSLHDVYVLDVSNPAAPSLSKAPIKPAAGSEPTGVTDSVPARESAAAAAGASAEVDNNGVPPSRGLHTLTAAGGGKLWLYGGAPQSGPMMDDLWSLDVSQGLSALQWHCEQSPAQAGSAAGERPHARCSHVAGMADQLLLISGGSYYAQPGKLEALSDVWLYDTQAHAWLQPQVEGSLPSPRNASVMVKLPSPADKYPAGSSSSSFLLVGGWKPFQHSYDDTFLLTVTA